VAGHGLDRSSGVARRISVPVQAKRWIWLFLASNLLWAAWGWRASAYALIILQVCLAAINIRGAQKNDPNVKTANAA
jgi:hypothetical protein